MEFLVATTSLPAVYRPNGYARTTTAGTPHARAKKVPGCINSVAEIKHLQLFEELLKLRNIQTSWDFALHKFTCIKLMT